MAHLACSFNLQLKNEAVVVGTKGILKLPSPFWCPTKLETPSVSQLTCSIVYYTIFISRCNCVSNIQAQARGRVACIFHTTRILNIHLLTCVRVLI